MEKFIDGIHVSEISNDNLNEKNMLPNFWHTQHLTITPAIFKLSNKELVLILF